MQRITPNLWFDGVAAQAAQFYADAFPGGRVLETAFYPEEGLPDFQAHMAGKELSVDVELAGLRLTCINAGPEFPITPAISFILNFDPATDDDARGSLDRLWERLADGGRVLMPLGEYPFSPHYGWVQDQFGMTWQLMLTDPAGEPRPFITPSLTFGGPAQNRAEEARDFYVSLFPDSGIGTTARYDRDTGPAPAGALMFSDFTLAGQWFAAMNPGMEQDSTFSEGVSLSVTCEDQGEIDRLWEALSAVPQAEQCGWCKDQFGVSWQIVPANMGELMQRPGAHQNMMNMKKLVIADF